MHATDLSLDHPSRELLHRFLIGKLPAVDLERLAAHLERCPACQEYLPAEVPGDPLIDVLRRPLQPEPHAEEPECQRRLETLARELGVRLHCGVSAHGDTSGPVSQQATATPWPAAVERLADPAGDLRPRT